MSAVLSGDAVFSADRVYRYALTRRVNEAGSDSVMFVCLNPSTADEVTDDPTVRRLTRFAREWGYLDMAVCNLFGYRATDPRQLVRVPDPVGPENDDWIEGLAGESELIVAAWGTHGALYNRGELVMRLLRDHGAVHTFGLTAAGHPKHPLYLRADTQPVAA